MLRRILILGVLALSACDAEDERPSSTQSPSDDAPVIATPNPVIDKKQFLDLFADLCLVAPRHLSYFRSTARKLGLDETRRHLRHETRAYGWSYPKEGKQSALEIDVSSAPILYEVIGDGSGLPTQVRNCSVSAFLAENDTKAQQDIETAVRKEFKARAEAMDFSRYSDTYDVTPRDMRIDVALSERTTYIDRRPNSGCPQQNPCWRKTPYTLSLEVIVERAP